MRRSVAFDMLAGGLLAHALIPIAWPIVAAGTDPAAWSGLRESWSQNLGTTAILLMGTWLIALPAGSIVAVTLVRLLGRSSLGWGAALACLAGLPLALQAGGWFAWIGPYGVLMPSALGLGASIRSDGWALAAVAGIHGMAAIPWVAGVLGISLWQRGTAAEEQALIETSVAGVLRRVTYGNIRSAFMPAMVLASVGVLTDMSVCDLFAIRSFAEEVYVQIELAGNVRSATLAAILPALFFVMLGSRSLTAMIERGFDAGRSSRLPERWVRASPVARMHQWVGLAILLVTLLPVAGLVRQLGLETEISAVGSEVRWSPSSAGNALANASRSAAESLAFSILISSFAGILATFTASVLSWRWVQLGRFGRTLSVLLALTSLVMPGPVLGLSLIEMLNGPDPLGIFAVIYDGPGVLILGQELRALPWIFLLQAGAVAQAGSSRWEMLRIEGYSESRIFWIAQWGAHRWQMGMSIVLASALSVAELPVTKIVAPPGWDPLGVRIFSLLHVGTTNEQAALALVLTTMIVVLVLLAVWLANLRVSTRADKR